MRIAITRVPGKGAEDTETCREFGHSCVHVSPLDAGIDRPVVDAFVAAANDGEFDCIFFTSALPARLIAPRLERPPRLVAIGPATAAALEEQGLSCETLPSYYSREFADTLGGWLAGKTVGIPRAAVPNPDLLQSIREVGGIPREFRVYTLTPTRDPLPLGDCDAILFTSALSFREAVWDRRPGIMAMAIGEITAAAMREEGIDPVVIGDGTIRGSLRALERRVP
ncbi:MAG: uroporphyrinogen-III synthase [Methanomicrobiales archaeon]